MAVAICPIGSSIQKVRKPIRAGLITIIKNVVAGLPVDGIGPYASLQRVIAVAAEEDIPCVG